MGDQYTKRIVPAHTLPPLTNVLVPWTKLAAGGELLANGANSLYRAGSGLLLAIVVGSAVGVLMGYSRLFDAVAGPLVRMFYPMPKSALIPVMAIWLGFGDASKIVLIFLGCMLPIAISAYNGARGVERELIWSARSLGASARRTAWEIIVPAALPQILTGLQVALPTALIVAIIAEMMMGGYGPGGATMESSRLLNSTGVFAGIVEIAIVGHCVISTISWLRRRLLIWHQEAQGPTTA